MKVIYNVETIPHSSHVHISGRPGIDERSILYISDVRTNEDGVWRNANPSEELLILRQMVIQLLTEGFQLTRCR